MTLTFTRRMLGATGALVVGLLASACMPADKTTQTITLAGSDTTQDLMGAIATQYNTGSTWNSDPDVLVNVLSQQPTALTAPADAHCASVTYRTPAGPGQTLAPNGSGAGRDALRNSANAGNGCIDVARSSSPPRAVPADNDTFEYWAYALDAVGWTSASSKAPWNLSLAQLRGIYNCTFTNWSQVGGTAGPIERYYPQAGSGTRSFFQAEVLGFDPTTFSGPSCPAVQLTQENTGETIAANGDKETAVVPYSMANWIAQLRGTQADQSADQVLRLLNGQSLYTFRGGLLVPNTAGPINESNVLLNNPTPAFPGVRYVFNVTDTTSPKADQSVRLFGFQNKVDGTESPLCDGAYTSLIESYGFGALDRTVGGQNLAASTCRVYTP